MRRPDDRNGTGIVFARHPRHGRHDHGRSVNLARVRRAVFQLGGTGAGQSDQITVVNGGVTLAGRLSVSIGYAARHNNDLIVISTNDGDDPVAATFAGARRHTEHGRTSASSTTAAPATTSSCSSSIPRRSTSTISWTSYYNPLDIVLDADPERRAPRPPISG